VTDASMVARPEIACRCAWLLVRAISRRSPSVQPGAAFEHRPGHLDVVVARKASHHLDRRIVDADKPLAEFSAGLGLDLLGEKGEDVVEHRHLVRAEPVAVVQEQVGDAAEGGNPLIGRAAVNDGLELFNERILRTRIHVAAPSGETAKSCATPDSSGVAPTHPQPIATGR
jgi:hypothetical protein